MNAAPAPEPSHGSGARGTPLPPGGLHTRRCARHPSREAAARCPSCTEFFCRECVVEHAGKLLCASCLARADVASERQRERRAALQRAAESTAGVLLLWLLFYWVGTLLLQIPPNFHDGTIWKQVGEDVVP